MPPRFNNGFTLEQANAALTARQGSIAYRFMTALLDNNNRFVRYLTTEVSDSGDYNNDTTRDTIKQCSFELIEPPDYKIDPYSHRFRLEVWINAGSIPAEGDGTPYLKYRVGVYVATGFHRVTRADGVHLMIEGEDLTHVLTYGTPAVYEIAAGTTYANAIKNLLLAARFPADQISVSGASVAPASLPLLVGMSYEINTPWVIILRDLANAIAYEWFFDENGIFIAQKWVDYAQRPAEWDFVPGDDSNDYPEEDIDEGAGLSTPNYVVGTVSRQTPTGVLIFNANAENTNQASKFSVPRRGFRIPFVMQLADAPDQPTFQEQVNRKLAEFSYSNRRLVKESAILPFLSPFSVVTAVTDENALMFGEFETDGNFESWTTVNITGAKVKDGILTGKASTGDPQIKRTSDSLIGALFNGIEYRWVRIVMKVYGQAGQSRVYFTTDVHTGHTDSKSVIFNTIPDGEFHTYFVDMFANTFWVDGKIAELRIDPTTINGRRFAVSSVQVWKTSNKYIVDSYSFQLLADARMQLQLKPVVATR